MPPDFDPVTVETYMRATGKDIHAVINIEPTTKTIDQIEFPTYSAPISEKGPLRPLIPIPRVNFYVTFVNPAIGWYIASTTDRTSITVNMTAIRAYQPAIAPPNGNIKYSNILFHEAFYHGVIGAFHVPLITCEPTEFGASSGNVQTLLKLKAIDVMGINGSLTYLYLFIKKAGFGQARGTAEMKILHEAIRIPLTFCAVLILCYLLHVLGLLTKLGADRNCVLYVIVVVILFGGWGIVQGVGQVETMKFKLIAFLCAVVFGMLTVYFGSARACATIETLNSGYWSQCGVYPKDMVLTLIFALNERSANHFMLHGYLDDAQFIFESLCGLNAYMTGRFFVLGWKRGHP